MSTVGFWRELRQDNRNIMLTGFGQLQRTWYIFPDGTGPRGSFTNFTDLAPNLRSRDIIVLGGVLREQAVAPLLVYDVTIIGAANRPRQATTATGGDPSAGTVTGGGACWLPPASGSVATTPLLELRAAGWSFENIEFSPHTSSAAIRLTRSGSVDTTDASHARFSECYFSGNGGTGQIGIEDNGGAGRVLVENCRFDGLASAILSLTTAAAIPLGWHIKDNRFQQNTNDVKMSLSYAIIERNKFMTAGSGSTNKVISTTFILTQGGNNHVLLNLFSNTEAQIAPTSGFTGASTDTWMNYVNDQAALAFGQPA